MKSQIEMRKLIKQTRLNLSSQDVSNLSLTIQNKVLGLIDINKYDNYFVYLDYKNEVKTDFIINTLISMGKTVLYPLIDGENMLAVKPLSNEFTLDKYGIKTPALYEIASAVDVAIVPLLAVDKDKNRVGYGKGYYDKFLQGKNVLKIGVCYDFQIVDGIQKNSWDVPLDIVVSNKQIIY